jgi:hypothetical protein
MIFLIFSTLSNVNDEDAAIISSFDENEERLTSWGVQEHEVNNENIVVEINSQNVLNVTLPPQTPTSKNTAISPADLRSRVHRASSTNPKVNRKRLKI